MLTGKKVKIMNNKKTRKDFELLADPIWDNEGILKPFFLDWWQRVAELHFGDKGKVLDAAKALGYIGPISYDPETGVQEGPVDFDYDPALYRQSLGIHADMPLISTHGDAEHFKPLWDRLLKEDGNG